MATKLTAFAALLEYAFLKPYIIPKDPDGYESSDFIGFSLTMALLAGFAEVCLKGLPDASRKAVLRCGAIGGVVGYAWLLFGVRYVDRRMHHLFITNCMVLAAIALGSRYERRRKRGPIWREPK